MKQDVAIVVGASIAGLLAAHVLTRHFNKVILIDRDELDMQTRERRGVPQGSHAHILHSSGLAVFESYFPGFTEQMVSNGAQPIEALVDGIAVMGGQRLARRKSGLHTIFCTRPLLEMHVRRRVLAGQTILLKAGCSASLIGDANQISGVMLSHRSRATEEFFKADLVVDASGRGTRTRAWMRSVGLPSAPEERIKIDVTYTTGVYQRDDKLLEGEPVLLVSATPPNRRCGGVIAQEGGRYKVTIAGYLGEKAGATHEAMLEFAKGMPSQEIADFLARATPIGEPIVTTYPASVRSRYERLKLFPRNLLVVGDALCSFNPIFGQGMSVAALEAKLLDRQFDLGCFSPTNFFRAAAKIVDAPWNIVATSDLQFEGVQGDRGIGFALLSTLLPRLITAASRNSEVALSLIRVLQLAAPNYHLLSPQMLCRILVHGRPDKYRSEG
jgi:2-polyprenyl-6-methoxyphenol hydroxylase-like FAD-dependent oxidoreductase